MNTTWNIDHEYATLFSSLSHTLWLSSVEIGFDSSLSVKTEYSEQKDKKKSNFRHISHLLFSVEHETFTLL